VDPRAENGADPSPISALRHSQLAEHASFARALSQVRTFTDQCLIGSAF
jgi:hypothetical protein